MDFFLLYVAINYLIVEIPLWAMEKGEFTDKKEKPFLRLYFHIGMFSLYLLLLVFWDEVIFGKLLELIAKVSPDGLGGYFKAWFASGMCIAISIFILASRGRSKKIKKR